MQRLIATTFVTLLCLLSSVSLASAGVLTFQIDPAKSSLAFSLETPGGSPISSAQTPGSDLTHLSGTLKLDLTAGAIQFLSTGDTHFALQAANQSPLAGGSAGASPAQYGLLVSIPASGGGTVAARNYLGDATSGPIALAGSSFDASQVSTNLVVGNTAYNLTIGGSPLKGSIDTNFPTLNSLTGGTLSLAGGLYTLTLPLLVKGPLDLSGMTIENVYSGQIVATATIPEPSSLLLAGLHFAGLAGLGWRRRKA